MSECTVKATNLGKGGKWPLLSSLDYAVNNISNYFFFPPTLTGKVIPIIKMLYFN